MYRNALSLCVVLLLAVSSTAWAQVENDDQENNGLIVTLETVYDSFKKSLLFSEDEQFQIQASVANVRSPVIDTLGQEEESETLEENVENTGNENQIIAPRLIRLSGIAYSSPKRWMIWINNKRLTPTQLLPEIIDIDVSHEAVRLKWFDVLSRQIIKLSLKPNQVYDIQNGLLLPGNILPPPVVGASVNTGVAQPAASPPSGLSRGGS